MSVSLLWPHGGTAPLHRDRLDASGFRVSVGVMCRLGEHPAQTTALLDTGAEWSLFGGGDAAYLNDGAPLGSIPVSTRLGRFVGFVHRMPLTLISEHGMDVTISATVLLAPDWPGPPILGFTGCLERVRFALVPDDLGQQTWFHFASS